MVDKARASSRKLKDISYSSPMMRTSASYAANATSMSATTKRKRDAGVEYNKAMATPTKRSRTTQHIGSHPQGPIEVIDLTGDSPTVSPKKRKTRKLRGEPIPERRARMFRNHAPKTFLDRLQRVRTQRMFVVGQTVTGTDEIPVMKFDVVGTTGNIYETTIGKEPFCNCPDGLKGNQCKHICYVLVNVLKAPEHLQYQLAFLSTELRDIYEGSPLSRPPTTSQESSDWNRKPIEGDCPVCFMEFEPATEKIVWCRAECGNNIHQTCFEKWAATQRSEGVRCVYCRSPWEFDKADVNLQSIRKECPLNEEGYVNVADQLGLSGERDYSTYHQPWVHRRYYSSGWARGYRY